MSLTYVCGACGQKWTENELDTEGAVGEYAWECPGCLSIQSLDNVLDETDSTESGDGFDSAADDEGRYECGECGQAWTESELVDEGSITDWMWVCPGCHAFHQEDD